MNNTVRYSLGFVVGVVSAVSVVQLFPNNSNDKSVDLPGAKSENPVDRTEAIERGKFERTSNQTGAETSPNDAWNEYLNSRNKADLVDFLVDNNFPEFAIRALISAVVHNEAYEKNPSILRSSDPKWWQPRKISHEENVSRLEIGNGITREISELMSLVPPRPETPQEQKRRNARYGDLTKEQIDQVVALEMDYDDLRAQQMMDSNLQPTASAQRLLEEERLEDLRQILSDDELLDYLARNDPSSQLIKHQLSGVDLSESEFLSVVEMYLKLNQSTLYAELSSEDEARVFADHRESQLSLERELGADRFFEVLAETDGAFKRIDRFTRSNSLGEDVARQLWRIKSSYDMNNPSVISSNGSNNQTIRDQLVGEITQILGPDGAEEFIDHSGAVLFGFPSG